MNSVHAGNAFLHEHSRESSGTGSDVTVVANAEELKTTEPSTFLWRLYALSIRILFKFILWSPVNFFLVLFIQAIRSGFWYILGGERKTSSVKFLNPHTHLYEKPKKEDKRSPCPALNMMANQRYLPRDGLDISRLRMIHALQRAFRLSYPLAWFITHGGWLLTGQMRLMSLHDLRRHNGIEHDASLAHKDATPEHEYAPSEFDRELFDMMAAESDDGVTLDIDAIARARVKREKACADAGHPIDPLHAEVARGEIGLILDIFGGTERRVNIEQLRNMWDQERFFDWKPTHEQTLARTIATSQGIKQRMIAIRTGTPYRQNTFQKLVKVYMVLCEPDAQITVDRLLKA